MNWLDRFVAYLSPSWGARRRRCREALGKLRGPVFRPLVRMRVDEDGNVEQLPERRSWFDRPPGGFKVLPAEEKREGSLMAPCP